MRKLLATHPPKATMRQCVAKEREMFFFEKQNQKTFILCAAP
jgi:hypothetical protein